MGKLEFMCWWRATCTKVRLNAKEAGHVCEHEAEQTQGREGVHGNMRPGVEEAGHVSAR